MLRFLLTVVAFQLNFDCYFDSANAKRKYKDQKFGFGGKKSGKKWNTKESYNDVSSFRAKVAHAKGVKGGKKGKGGKNVSHTLYSQLMSAVFLCCLNRVAVLGDRLFIPKDHQETVN